MRRRTKIGLFILLAGLIGGGVWFFQKPTEPLYKGKRCSKWLEELAMSTAPKGSQEAEDAINHIGTNALPCMLRMLAAKDSAFKTRLIDLTVKQRLITFHWQDARVSRECASFAFAVFGPHAKPAVPGLIDLLADNDPEVRGRTLEALASIGHSASNAVPTLVKLIKSNDERFIEEVRSTLKAIDPDALAQADPENLKRN